MPNYPEQHLPHYVDLLRLSSIEVQSIMLELLPRLNGGKEGKERREHERTQFTEEALLLFTMKSKDGVPPFRVKSVDISATGMGFLHGGFVHAGTSCELILVTRDRRGFRINSQVARCTHVRRHVHLVGVRFDQAIDDAKIAMMRCAA